MFRKLLIPLDGSPIAEEAIGDAVAIARVSHSSLDLVLVHEPVTIGGIGDAPWNEERCITEARYIDAFAREISSRESILVTDAVLCGGEPARLICKRAIAVGADLVVMVSHGLTGFRRTLLGSVADGVLRNSTVPVLLLRARDAKQQTRSANELLRRVLVPLDGSAPALEIMTAASELARCYGSHLILLRVVQPVPLPTLDIGGLFAFPEPAPDSAATARLRDDAKQQLDEVVRTLVASGTTNVEAHVVTETRVANAIVEFARRNDVSTIAMTTRGRGASRLLLGSVADKVLRGSNLPMLFRHPAALTEDQPLLDEASVVEQLPALSEVCAVSP